MLCIFSYKVFKSFLLAQHDFRFQIQLGRFYLEFFANMNIKNCVCVLLFGVHKVLLKEVKINGKYPIQATSLNIKINKYSTHTDDGLYDLMKCARGPGAHFLGSFKYNLRMFLR